MLDRRPLHALLAALKPIGDRDSNIPAAWIKTLLLVALDEGKGVAHYSRAAKVHRTIMSRYLHCIGDKKRRDDIPGLGLEAPPFGGSGETPRRRRATSLRR
jgi:hypothetical protein